MQKLSQKELEVLTKIEIVKAQGYEPNISSLARLLELSYQRTRTILLELESKGYIKTIQAIKGCNRTTSGRKFVVTNPVLTERERLCVSGNDLTLDDIKGNIVV